jgi:hypothetical protein
MVASDSLVAVNTGKERFPNKLETRNLYRCVDDVRFVAIIEYIWDCRATLTIVTFKQMCIVTMWVHEIMNRIILQTECE